MLTLTTYFFFKQYKHGDKQRDTINATVDYNDTQRNKTAAYWAGKLWSLGLNLQYLIKIIHNMNV